MPDPGDGPGEPQLGSGIWLVRWTGSSVIVYIGPIWSSLGGMVHGRLLLYATRY